MDKKFILKMSYIHRDQQPGYESVAEAGVSEVGGVKVGVSAVGAGPVGKAGAEAGEGAVMPALPLTRPRPRPRPDLPLALPLTAPSAACEVKSVDGDSVLD